jgi:hypothetical protein
MSIYTFDFSKSISSALGLKFSENVELSDQVLYETLKEQTTSKIPSVLSTHIAAMTEEERKQLTLAANAKKRGMKESSKSKGIKSVAQKKRWANMTETERKEMGIKSRNGIFEENRKTQTLAAISAYSPAREKGLKKPLIKCPHCGIIGGAPIMKRYHFERCKML